MRTINGLLEFIHVAENNSFSEASRSTGVSKSHISKQVARLEDELQVRLLNRTTRKITLTDSGKLLYEKSRHIFEELEQIHSEVTQTQKEPSGTIKISVAGAFAEEHLSKALTLFLKDHKKIKLEMNFNNRVVDLIEESYDLGIRYGQLEDSSLISKRLVSRREYICASPEYLKLNSTPLTPKDLAKHNCLVGTNPTWKFSITNRSKSIKVKGNWKSNNGRSLSVAAKNGLGIAMLPASYVADEIESGELVPILDDYLNKNQNVWIVYPNKKHLSPKIRIFIDYLSSYFEKHHTDTNF